jgi:hypothetical protein
MAAICSEWGVKVFRDRRLLNATPADNRNMQALTVEVVVVDGVLAGVVVVVEAAAGDRVDGEETACAGAAGAGAHEDVCPSPCSGPGIADSGKSPGKTFSPD